MEILLAGSADYEEIVAVWERSVVASHDFIPREYFEYLRLRLPDIYLPMVRLYCHKKYPDGEIDAFVGVRDDCVEMLFVHPDAMGKGIGIALLRHAVEQCGARRVWVNEQNTGALAFYRRCGFRVVGRSEVDGEGRPYPLLELEYADINSYGE